MASNDTPKSIDELIAALADGELDLREQPDALTQLAQDPKASGRVAYQQQLRAACCKAMDTPEMKCPDELAAMIKSMAGDTADTYADDDDTPVRKPTPVQAQPIPQLGYQHPPMQGPPVLARIGRWAPTAVAAMLLIVAGVLFSQANPGNSSGLQAASLIPVDQIQAFNGRHGDCAMNTALLKESQRFGDATQFNELPGKLSNYFHTSTDGMRLSLDGIGYDYQLTGACGLPGNGAVHIVYRNHNNPDRAISVWVMPAREEHAVLEEGRVYSETGGDLLHPVIYWRQGDLLYYLVGDSIEDCDKAVKALQDAA